MGLPAASDRQLDTMIGVLLRVGVGVAAILVAVGMALMVGEHRVGMADIGVHARARVHLPGMRALFHMAFVDFRPSAWIDLGLIALVMTPILRVAASLVVFLYENDHQYVYFTAIVLAVLIYSLSGG